MKRLLQAAQRDETLADTIRNVADAMGMGDHSGPIFPDPLATQVGGDHYRHLPIQPVQYIHANGIGYMEGNVIKYVTRWKAKNGLADLRKAKHYIELLIELEEKANATRTAG